MSSAEQYARDVLAPGNEQKTGRLIKLAAQRFLDDLKREDIYFDEGEAVKMVNFGERYCVQWEGDWEGVPFKFEPWQRFIFEQLYGWIRKDNGSRRFEEAYIQISKKNGKSSMCAALMNFHLFADERIKTPKIFTAANNEDQAKICVNMAGRIIQASPELKEFLDDGSVAVMNYKENITEVVHYGKNGFIKAFAKESGDKTSKTAGGKHGINASLGIVDEWGMSPDHGASKPIKTSMASRLIRLMWKITTAGFNLEGPCYKEDRKIGIEVLEKLVVKDNFLVIIYEIDEPIVEGKKQDITAKWLLENEWSWGQSNPNIDVSVYRDFLRSQLLDAITYGGETEIDTLTLNFNKWCASPETWISADTWNKNHLGNKEEILAGGRCFGAVELVPGLDLSCLTLFFPEFDGTNNAVKLLCWCPSDAIKNKNLTLDVASMADVGLIALDAGNVVDNQFAFELIVNELSNYNCQSIAYRKVQENSDVVQALIKSGVKMNPIKKSYNELDTPTKEWEKLLTAGQVEHFNNPVLSWMNLNTMVNKSKDGEIKVIQAGGRTSGIVAGVHALAEWMTFKAQDQNDAVLTSWK